MAEKRSSMKNKREQQRKKAAKARRVRRTLLVITEFLLVCALSICCYAVSILNTMQRSTINQTEIYVATFANNGDNDQQGEGQPPEGDTASKAEGQRIIQKQERCGGYGRGVQHIQKKGEDHHDDDPSAKADHGLDGPAQKGDRSDQHQVHTQHLPIVSHSRRRAAIAVIITEDNDLVKILSRNWSKTE